jgi:hypothetical protein
VSWNRATARKNTGAHTILLEETHDRHEGDEKAPYHQEPKPPWSKHKTPLSPPPLKQEHLKPSGSWRKPPPYSVS